MKKGFLMLAFVSILALLLVGCQDEPGQPGGLAFEYVFADSAHGWTGDFTDLPVDYEPDIYELEFAHTQRPENLPRVGSNKALMLSAINRSDDIFMYAKKLLTSADGIKPNTTYLVRFAVEFATDAPPGVMGIGGPPGEAVWVKVGAAPMEPIPVNNGDSAHPMWVTNVDKGHQNEDGEHALRIGDVAKVDNEEFDVYELKTLNNDDQALEVTSDEDGNLWIFVGTDSGFEGRTTLYYTQISVGLQEK